MPEEHTGQLGFEFAWKELLMRSRQSGMWFCACFPVLRSPRFSIFRRTHDLQFSRLRQGNIPNHLEACHFRDHVCVHDF